MNLGTEVAFEQREALETIEVQWDCYTEKSNLENDQIFTSCKPIY